MDILKNLDILYTILDQTSNIILITDNLGKIEYVNPKFTELTGYTYEEVKGKNSSIFKFKDFPKENYAELWSTISSGKTWIGTFTNKKKNNELYYDKSTISPIKDSFGNIIYYINIKEDVTDLILSINKEKLYLKRLEILNSLISVANSAEDMDILYAKTLNATLDLTNFDCGAVYIADSSKKMIELTYNESMPNELLTYFSHLCVCNFNKVYIDGFPIFMASSNNNVFPQQLLEQGFSSLAIIPLTSNNAVLGSLNVLSKETHNFTDDEQHLLLTIGKESGNAINKLIFEEKIKQSLKEKELLLQEINKKNIELQKASITDGLTKLYNHKYIVETLDCEISKLDNITSPLSIIMFDIDHFKKVNDTYGHLFGDKVLIEVSKTLSDLCGENNIAGRYGGEEFLVVLPNTDEDFAFSVAERLREAIWALKWDVPGFFVTVSLGVMQLLANETASELINNADTLLYKAKQSGRNRTCR